VGRIQSLAKGSQDQLSGALRWSVIPTIGPYHPSGHRAASSRNGAGHAAHHRGNLTANLAPMLREGELDVAIIALPAFAVPGVRTEVVYEEPFNVVVPEGHRWQGRKSIKPGELAEENLLVLQAGNCFRDQVLEACPAAGKTRRSTRAVPAAPPKPSATWWHSGSRRERAPSERGSLPAMPRAPQVRSFRLAEPITEGGARVAHELRRPIAVQTLADAIRAVRMPCLRMTKAA
jgi:LysR family hydrogen peroxide-inducible transcriptional activator